MRRFWIFWSVDRCHNAHSIYLYQTNTLFNINRHQDCEKIRQSWSPLVLSSVFDNYCSWMEDSERDDESISKYSFSQICVQILAPPRSRKFVWKGYDIPQICDPSRKFARLPHNCVIRKGIHAELRESRNFARYNLPAKPLTWSPVRELLLCMTQSQEQHIQVRNADCSIVYR